MLREPGRLSAYVGTRHRSVVAGVDCVEFDVFVDVPSEWSASPRSL